jgi:hypothetical protein
MHLFTTFILAIASPTVLARVCQSSAMDPDYTVIYTDTNFNGGAEIIIPDDACNRLFSPFLYSVGSIEIPTGSECILFSNHVCADPPLTKTNIQPPGNKDLFVEPGLGHETVAIKCKHITGSSFRGQLG